MADRRPKPAKAPAQGPAKRPPRPKARPRPKKKKVRYGRGIKKLTPALLATLLNAGWLPPEKKPVGRPKLDIDPAQVEALAAMFHTQLEIADFFGCSVDTIKDRFSEQLTRGAARGKMSLRAKQYERAVKQGSDRMLIWLGRQALGQRERLELSNDPDAPFEFYAEVPDSPFAGAAPDSGPPAAALPVLPELPDDGVE